MGEISYRTLREKVVDEIRKKILNHELQPGSRIIEQDISSEFRVSRGPIREAFRQLEQEGLVEYTRNVGCSVKTITVKDVFEVHMLRLNYELIAIKSCKGHIPKASLSEMKQILKQMEQMDGKDFSDIITYDNLFHRSIVKAAGLPRLLKAWTDLDYATILSCSIESRDSQTVTGWQHQVHQEIFDAYGTGDTEKICRVVADHYIRTIERKIKEQNDPKEDLSFSVDILEALV